MLAAASNALVCVDVMFAFASICRFIDPTAFECQLRLFLITSFALSAVLRHPNRS